MSTELERGELDGLAADWRSGWRGKGFEVCCTPDVSYEDPVAVRPLRGVEALDRHAVMLLRAFPDLRVEATAPPLGRGEHACVPWRATGTHTGDIGTVLPATDRFVALHGLHYLELSDGASPPGAGLLRPLRRRHPAQPAARLGAGPARPRC